MKVLMFRGSTLLPSPILKHQGRRSLHLSRQVCGIAYWENPFGMRLKRGFHRALSEFLSTTKTWGNSLCGSASDYSSFSTP